MTDLKGNALSRFIKNLVELTRPALQAPRIQIGPTKILSIVKNYDANEEKGKPPKPIDNSPILDSICFRDTMEQVSALNLGNLAHELESLTHELPLLDKATKQGTDQISPLGYLMAVSCEAGRRYCVYKIIAMLEEETGGFDAGRLDEPPGAIHEA